MSKIKLALLSLVFSVPLLAGVPAQAQIIDDSCEELTASERAQSAICNPTTEEPLKGEGSIFITIANVLSLVAGVIAVIIIIVSGITMMTSGGDPAKVKSSRDAIIYTVVGIAVIVLSRSLVIYVINLVG